LKSRLQRMLQKAGQEQTSTFQELTREEKSKFFITNRKLMGEDLSVAVQEVITVKLTKKQEVEFKGTGEFLDEDDIRAKYAKKPKQAESIIQNSRSMFDPIRETTLYEDMNYNSKVANSEVLEDATGSSLTHDRHVKGKPVAKKEKGPGIKTEKIDEVNEFSDAQKTSLVQMVSEINEVKMHLDAELQNIQTNDVKEFMVAASVTLAEACGCKMKEFVASIGVVLDSNSGDFKELKSQHRELKSDGKDQARRMKGQIKTAMDLKSEMLGTKPAKGNKRKAAAPTVLDLLGTKPAKEKAEAK
jgi:predicted nucleic acid-binding Zn ribbon protein